MKLSILICSLKARSLQLNKLLLHLNKQQKGREHIEVITSVDDGEMKIGAKRNKLLGLAGGEYIAFIDDDDWVADNYIDLILEAIETEPDCVGINLTYTLNGKNPETAIHSLKYKEWVTRKVGTKNFYERTPNHLNPVKKEIALRAKFPEEDHGEDHVYSNELRHILQNEVMIEAPIYFYRCKGETKVISFGAPNEGSINTVKKVKEYLMDWKCRFYCPTGISYKLIHELKELGAEVLVKDIKLDDSHSWKFECAFDSKVSRFIIAFSDTKIDINLVKLINKWEKTSKKALNYGSIWGATKGFLPQFKDLYFNRIKNEEFMSNVIWPLINGEDVFAG